MPLVDKGAKWVTMHYCQDCGEPISGAHDCPGIPTIKVYPGEQPQAAWVRKVGDTIPPGAHQVYTIWVGKTPIGVYVKFVRDDREGNHGNTTVRTFN